MVNRITASFLGRGIFGLMVFLLSVNADRCDYAQSAFDSQTIWKYEGEYATLSCPGYADNSPSFTLDYKWFQGDYNCKNMSKIVAHYMENLEGKSAIDLEHPERMTINKLTGKLTIREVEITDEQIFTCIFMRLKEYIATVHLKIKEFQAPKLTGLSDYLTENEVRDVTCEVPRMHPTEGYIQMRVDDKVVSVENLEHRNTPPPLQLPIAGDVEAQGHIVTCVAVQNVSGSVKTLSTSAKITVLHPYHTNVTSSVPDQPVEFSNVSLACEVARKGYPTEMLNYTWLKDGQEISSEERIVITRATDEDAGIYQCLISNMENMSTPLEAATELRLDAVPLDCLPKLDFNSADIKLERRCLSVSWTMNFPSGCQDYNPAVEISVQVHAENITWMLDNTVWMSEEQVVIHRRFNIGTNYEICLIFKDYPANKFCQMTMKEPWWNYVRLAGMITGCSLLGCGFLAGVGFVTGVMSKRSKKWRIQVVPRNEDPYEDLTGGPGEKHSLSRRNILPRDSEPVNIYEESNPTDELRKSCLPTPPPLPDVRDLTHGKLLDLCPNEEQHYANRTAIMATIPRPKKSHPILARAESLEELIESCKDDYDTNQDTTLPEDPETLEDLIESCEDNYGTNQNTTLSEDKPIDPDRSEDYMDMQTAASIVQEIEMKVLKMDNEQ